MNLDDFAHKMGIPIYHMDVGDNVICDVCGKNWTRSDESGGFLFGSYGYCPDCEKGGALDRIKGYNEEHLIKGFCPPDMSHADWIRNVVRKGLL